jgi:acyl-CoA-binding protein
MQPQEPNNTQPQNPSPLPQDSHVQSSAEPATPTQPAAPSAGQVFAPGTAQPAQTNSMPDQSSVSPTQNPSSASITPQPIISGSSLQQEGQKKKGFKPSKKMAVILALPLIFIGSGAAAYFGYVIPNKPENVWGTALANTGKGYDKLSEYATSKKETKPMSVKGSFKVSGEVAADGAFDGISDGKNGQLTGTVSAVGLKVNYDVRALESPGNTPDIYFKVDGIQGLGDLVGSYAGLIGEDSATLKKTLNGVNGQWYFVDHTLFDQFAQGANGNLQITSSDVSGALKAVGDSSKQYLFTSDPAKMAVVVKQNVGKETQDGRKVYHYKVAVNKENLQAYNKSLCENLIKTKLFKLFSQNTSGDEDFSKECQDATGISKVKDTQTADAWVDLHTKLIHKIRIKEKDNANNYVDIAQDYQGGDEFPFSIGLHSQDSVDNISTRDNQELSNPTPAPATTVTGLIKMKLNMKTDAFSAEANFDESGPVKSNGTFKLTLSPTTEKVKTEKPANSKTIIQLLNDLGFGDISAAGSQTSAGDAKRRTDINVMATQMEVYYTDNGSYPLYAGQLNSDAWIKANLKGADINAWRAPNQTSNSMVPSATPTKDQYGYVALQDDGKTPCTKAPCARYQLYWFSEKDGTVHNKESLN